MKMSENISSISTIKDALLMMKAKNVKYLLIRNEVGGFLGVLDWHQICDLYLNNVPVHTTLDQIVKETKYEIIIDKNEIQESTFFKKEVIVLQDHNELKVITKTEFLSSLIKDIKERIGDMLQIKNNEVNLDISKLFKELATKYELLNKTMEKMPFSIFISNNERKAIYLNEKFENSMGVTREDIIGKNLSHIDRLNLFWPSISPIILEEKRQVSVIQHIVKSEIKTVVTGIPIFDTDNKLQWVVTISRELQKDEFPTNNTSTKVLKIKNNKYIFKNKQMKEIINLTEQLFNVNSTVLITGESGVGKDAIAELIHEGSNRKDNPYVHINCGAIPESLLESELFGYETGAFSGASKKGKQGLIEAADTGTLFLNEIGEMPLNVQVKLLQVLQNKQITRVGSTKPINIDVRIIAATNKNLKEQVKSGKFRLDLFYRLNVIPIYIPPLRERKEDILPLTYAFLEKYTKRFQKEIVPTLNFEEDLLSYLWPGNIRELDNLIERLVVTSKGRFIDKNNLKASLFDSPFQSSNKINNSNDSVQPIVINQIIPLKQALNKVEAQLINMAYDKTKNSYKLAETLGISQSSAHRKIQKHITKVKVNRNLSHNR